MTILDGSVVLVTGANGGLGREFVEQALARGASKVYASARTPQQWSDPRVVPLALDVTDDSSIAAAVAAASDTTVLINNAGVGGGGPISGDQAAIREIFETNFFGALSVASAFAPVLKANGGGVLLNVHSLLSWLGVAGAYSATKAALWSATNSLRLELAPQGTHVVGLHVGYVDTPMTVGVTAPKNDAVDVVRDAYDGIEAGDYEVLADEGTIATKASLAKPIAEQYPQLAR
jgi:NAD(P)-dependent dehydrogenase (short-subunit alcohol dehydrogenase family)